MTANELLKFQLNDVSYQLEQVLEGVDESDLDLKLAPTARSIRETVEHLCEVYVAVEEGSRGVEHEWGSYEVEDKNWSNLLDLYRELKTKAVAVIADAEDDKALTEASGFMVGHEYYHVGQLASIRLATNPSWDAYSIYPHG